MTDQTPEQRVAAALHAICEADVKAKAERDPDRLFTQHMSDAHISAAIYILAADPTLVCPDPDDHARIAGLRDALVQLRRQFTHGGLFLTDKNRDRLTSIVDAALEGQAEPTIAPKPTCAACGHTHNLPKVCYATVERNNVRTVTKRCDCALERKADE